MFLLKGEALVNSEEYAGVTLHAGEFILQAVGSKYEVLAMTDVECVCYRFSQPESFCEGRFQHIVKDVVPPLEPNIVKYQSDYQILISEIVW